MKQTLINHESNINQISKNYKTKKLQDTKLTKLKTDTKKTDNTKLTKHKTDKKKLVFYIGYF